MVKLDLLFGEDAHNHHYALFGEVTREILEHFRRLLPQ
jgi:hypothetical protein